MASGGIRLKIDVTPGWWRTKTEDPEQFAGWLVKAVRVLLGVWSDAEVRLSKDKLVAVVSFDREERVGMVAIDKRKVREALDEIAESSTDGSFRINAEFRDQDPNRIATIFGWDLAKVGGDLTPASATDGSGVANPIPDIHRHDPDPKPEGGRGEPAS